MLENIDPGAVTFDPGTIVVVNAKRIFSNWGTWWGNSVLIANILDLTRPASILLADPEKNFVLIMKDGKIYKNTIK